MPPATQVLDFEFRAIRNTELYTYCAGHRGRNDLDQSLLRYPRPRPLWVKSRHHLMSGACPFYLRKRTFISANARPTGILIEQTRFQACALSVTLPDRQRLTSFSPTAIEQGIRGCHAGRRRSLWILVNCLESFQCIYCLSACEFLDSGQRLWTPARIAASALLKRHQNLH